MSKINDFDNQDGRFYKVYRALKQKRRELRFGAWTTDQENAMLASFMHDREEAVKDSNHQECEFDFPIPAQNKYYFYSDSLFLELDKSTVEKLYIKAAFNLAGEEPIITDSIFLSAVIDAINVFIPLSSNVETAQKEANRRAVALYNVCKMFDVSTQLIEADNSETGEQSYFVLIPGITMDTDDNERDAWQIVNPAAYSIVTMQTFEFSYPNRCFLAEKHLDTLLNSPKEFAVRFEAKNNNQHIRDSITDPNAKIANYGNLDFGVANLVRFPAYYNV